VDGEVTMPDAFKHAYRQFVSDGWPQLRAPTPYGGQAAPYVLATAVEELWASANLSFKHVSMLSQGAIEALHRCATNAQKMRYLPRLVSGEWTGTMNLTEPQAGSDLAAIRTRAVPDGDRYRLFGKKLFISYGDHDLAANVIHLVLARLDGAPSGSRGISLFVVPKFLFDAAGALGVRNDIRCLSIEHKLGARGSPTCLLSYGEGEGAIGELVGEANRGLEYMFVMMNSARLSVGLEGYALAERSYQQARDWAHARVQGSPLCAGAKHGQPLPIAYHPDVARMLLTMSAGTQAARALALYVAGQLDVAKQSDDGSIRAHAQQRADLLIPVVKGWSTELGIRLTSLGIQVHGGMGFVEETGAAQFYRDVRGAALYEGTTGIQANDLVGRKLVRDKGVAMHALLEEMRSDLHSAERDIRLREIHRTVAHAIGVLNEATVTMLNFASAAPRRAQAVAVAYLEMCGTVVGGWLMARAAMVAITRLTDRSEDPEFYAAKLQSARFYVDNYLPSVLALGAIVNKGSDAIVESDCALL
jgi:alkylation response protein AidB-like acyl-CoA dehydrogenase